MKKFSGKFFGLFIRRNLNCVCTSRAENEWEAIVMDNDPSQRSKAAAKALEDIKAELLEIPACSPDVDCIENVFNLVKCFLEEEMALDRLEKEGVVTKVSHSAWAAPVVVVPKADGGIRLCGDFKVTVNQVLDVDKYPLPNPQDLLSALAGGARFMKLDLKHAYQQLPLSKDSKQFLTINTSKGLYQYNRLPFGVASAPAIFQSTIDTILKGIDGVVCYIDDILITGRNDQEPRSRLEAVLSRLERYGVQLKLSKCSFLQEKVQFLGHVIDAEGVHPSPEKVQAIVGAPSPANVTELRSFLGMLQYYGKFLPNLSTLLHPLNDLLREGVSWSWQPECQKAFESAKQLLQRFWPTMMLTFLLNWPVMPLHMVSVRCYHM